MLHGNSKSPIGCHWQKICLISKDNETVPAREWDSLEFIKGKHPIITQYAYLCCVIILCQHSQAMLTRRCETLSIYCNKTNQDSIKHADQSESSLMEPSVSTLGNVAASAPWNNFDLERSLRETKNAQYLHSGKSSGHHVYGLFYEPVIRNLTQILLWKQSTTKSQPTEFTMHKHLKYISFTTKNESTTLMYDNND